jgi:rod shape-determining protein MreC
MKRHSFVRYAIILVFIIIVIRQIPDLSYLLSQVTSYALYPVLVIERSVLDPLKSWYKDRAAMHEMRAEQKKLQEERLFLLEENNKLHAMLNHCSDIQEVVDFGKRYTTPKKVIASVLLKQFSPHAHYFFVDAGSNRGIEPDMVAVYKNCLIGRVAEVYRWYSKVVLITDRSCKVAAVCRGTSAQGIHEGCQQQQTTQLSFVSHLAKVKKGDVIVSSGEGLIFPRGFALGKISNCASDNVYYHIEVQPLVDVSLIDTCYLLAKGSIYEGPVQAISNNHAVSIPQEEVELPAPVALAKVPQVALQDPPPQENSVDDNDGEESDFFSTID